MSFSRNLATKWHNDVPGARWFRADLHVHTIDDHPGGRAKVPQGLQCADLTSPEFLRDYARTFLRAAIAANVHVVALTPHAVKTGNSSDSSAVWAIVDCWNDEDDDDGVPFREKIYGVFPGFEPSFNTGSDGLHLLFLFDPEIGRDRYMEAFTLVMGGVQPWSGSGLQLSSRSASEAFEELVQFRQRQDELNWDHLVVAPHVDSEKGLFKAQKKQALALFDHGQIAALEISDNKLPAEVIAKKGAWFADGLSQYRQALYHASDAYKVLSKDDPKEFELGHRITWLKLAQPRVEALRQAFLAADSRVAIAYERDSTGKLVERADAPVPVPTSRPWVRTLAVEGGASFFGGTVNGLPRRTEIPFNPGLTCVIGASMTGKSTLLDGLRRHVGAQMPGDTDLAKVVQQRGEGLLRGSPALELDTPGQSDGPPRDRWPAAFYTQSELQALMRSDGVVEILLGLAGPERAEIERLGESIRAADAELTRAAGQLARLLEERDEAAQRKLDADQASKALQQFEDAGLAGLRVATRLSRLVEGAVEKSAMAEQEVVALRATVEAGALAPEVLAQVEGRSEGMAGETPLGALHASVIDATETLESSIAAWRAGLEEHTEATKRQVSERRSAMERSLHDAGLGTEELANLKTLTKKAELRDSYKQAAEEVAAKLETALAAFHALVVERAGMVDERRRRFDAVVARVDERFGGALRVRRDEHAVAQPLEAFLKGLGQKGISQWWNALGTSRPPSPGELVEALESDSLGDLGVSGIVAQRFAESIGEATRYRLRALRSDDRYVFEQKLESGEFRSAEELSGGRRVSLLLSLLLEMDDMRPLVIDQPEDELDNRVLWSTVLPALRRIKGRRQVILVTHNANIVVNGDADLVVQLEADADHGRVSVCGAIEQPDVRRAIVDTVDGGQEAFGLRKAKYGF